ncbi:MAG: tryptophan--tRNA ligase [Candidatus Thermoplasmatota archaeon]|jgi:tryptophanyl-tRNA synthetase|nr:tryptophan--tRNA ligase [Candidatus Thermoplasmatota archaeon]MCL5794138.1 tryptophan--tRNA ligase [Candidatus Thermoplasmatota archaeon]
MGSDKLEIKDQENRDTVLQLTLDHQKLIERFGARKMSDLKEKPDFYSFRNNLIVSHRDFDGFYSRLKAGNPSAIVSGFNASSYPHIGHIGVFDTNRYFQEKYGCQVFIPISDDESYVSGKVKSQEEGLKKSLLLARSAVALGFKLGLTRVIIDQLYTNVYNFAIRLSRSVTMSMVKASYGYGNDRNVGLFFYPAVQSAHVLMPNLFGIGNVLVPIGPDEDPHLRICRDIAELHGYRKPAVIHSKFMPGIDGGKMSKSKGNAIFLVEDEKTIRKKIANAFSGGQASIEEHRRVGGNLDIDVPFIYLKHYFLSPEESARVGEEYRSGRLLSGEMKKMLTDRVVELVAKFQDRYSKVKESDLMKVIIANEEIDLQALFDRLGIFEEV